MKIFVQKTYKYYLMSIFCIFSKNDLTKLFLSNIHIIQCKISNYKVTLRYKTAHIQYNIRNALFRVTCTVYLHC